MILRNTVASAATKFFNRTWSAYQQEFGTLDSLYWIGLDKLHELSQRGCAVRFDMKAANGSSYYAQYSSFVVGGSANNYTLILGGFSGNIGDSLSYHNNTQFQTIDHAFFSYPAALCGGGWWYFLYSSAYLTSSVPANFQWGYFELGPDSTWRNVIILLNSIEARFAC